MLLIAAWADVIVATARLAHTSMASFLSVSALLTKIRCKTIEIAVASDIGVVSG